MYFALDGCHKDIRFVVANSPPGDGQPAKPIGTIDCRRARQRALAPIEARCVGQLCISLLTIFHRSASITTNNKHKHYLLRLVTALLALVPLGRRH